MFVTGIDNLTSTLYEILDALKINLDDSLETRNYSEAKDSVKEMFRSLLLLEKIEEYRTEFSKSDIEKERFLSFDMSELRYFDQCAEDMATCLNNRHALKIIK